MIRIAAFSFTSLCLALAAFAALEAYVIAWSPEDEFPRVAGVSVPDARPLSSLSADGPERPCPRDPDRSST